MISSNQKVSQFQQQVGFILSNLSEPSVNDKLMLLMNNLNVGQDSDLPFIVPEKGDEGAKECLKKLNDLYLDWKNKGCDEVYLQSVIEMNIHRCIAEYLGGSDKEVGAPSEQYYDALLSQDDIKKQQRDDNKCCTIF